MDANDIARVKAKEITYMTKLPFAEQPIKSAFVPTSVAGSYAQGQSFTVSVSDQQAFLDLSQSYFSFDLTVTLTGATDLTYFLDDSPMAIFSRYRMWIDSAKQDLDDYKMNMLAPFLYDMGAGNDWGTSIGRFCEGLGGDNYALKVVAFYNYF